VYRSPWTFPAGLLKRCSDARAEVQLLGFMMATCAIGFIPALLAAQGQHETKMHQIGVLTDNAPQSLFAEGFRESLRDLGYVEGRNLAIDWRSTQAGSAPLGSLASELVRSKVDVIVATYPAATFAAKSATATIPIVMVHTPDPVQLGLVASLARPGGNITGLTSLSAELSTKQLELLKEAVPRASRIAVLWNPANPWHPITVKSLEAGGRSLKIQLQMVPVRGQEDFQNAFATMRKARAQAVLLLADPATYVHRQRLADLAIGHRLAAMGGPREFAEAGSLLSYWANTADLSRRTASYVDKILRGARPGDLPIEQPTQYELVVNLKTAKTLAFTIPSSLLLRATIIE
jgi:putative ABC transport system substrate-binding protein